MFTSLPPYLASTGYQLGVSLWVPEDVVFDARFPSNSRFFNENSRSRIADPASSSNHDDDDGDEKLRKGEGSISKKKKL